MRPTYTPRRHGYRLTSCAYTLLTMSSMIQSAK